MRCVTCGSTETRVLSTREWQDGATLKRRRECAHGHRFTTVEVVENKTITKYSLPSSKAVAKRNNLWTRDTAIIFQVRAGKSVKDAAETFGIAPNTVSWILKRRAPELTRAGAT